MRWAAVAAEIVGRPGVRNTHRPKCRRRAENRGAVQELGQFRGFWPRRPGRLLRDAVGVPAGCCPMLWHVGGDMAKWIRSVIQFHVEQCGRSVSRRARHQPWGGDQRGSPGGRPSPPASLRFAVASLAPSPGGGGKAEAMFHVEHWSRGVSFLRPPELRRPGWGLREMGDGTRGSLACRRASPRAKKDAAAAADGNSVFRPVHGPFLPRRRRDWPQTLVWGLPGFCLFFLLSPLERASRLGFSLYRTATQARDGPRPAGGVSPLKQRFFDPS